MSEEPEGAPATDQRDPLAADNETSPFFIPDAPTCRWAAFHIAANADRELHRANLYLRGQDRACAKARLDLYSRIMKIFLVTAAMVDAGEYPPKPKEGEKEQSPLVTP